jgi:hypothetical protein
MLSGLSAFGEFADFIQIFLNLHSAIVPSIYPTSKPLRFAPYRALQSWITPHPIPTPPHKRHPAAGIVFTNRNSRSFTFMANERDAVKNKMRFFVEHYGKMSSPSVSISGHAPGMAVRPKAFRFQDMPPAWLCAPRRFDFRTCPRHVQIETRAA